MTYTPGPWEWNGDELRAGEAVVLMIGGGYDGLWGGTGATDADESLIAAAPDLLAACELMTSPAFRESFLDVVGNLTLAKIKSAICKAKGL